jgi:hypothetical protein
MGCYGEQSIARIITLDNYKYESGHNTRDDAFIFLKLWTHNISYKEAVIEDFNTGEIVLSLRTII